MKNKIYNGVEIMSLAAGGGRGRVRLRAQLEPGAIRPVDAVKLAERLKAAGSAQLWFDGKSQVKNDNFNFERIEDVLPSDADYIVVPFRAISKTLVEGYWLDFTGDGVLEPAAALIYGQTVYPNHDRFDVNNALGSIAAAVWDPTDKAQKGAPGINVQYKIDALMNPRISRLLLMTPPGIHSTSLTLVFEFDFSHPDLVEQGRFWNLLGEEVEGEIVRLKVTRIHECYEGSLVYMGADRMAKQIDTDDETVDDEESFSAKAEEAAELKDPPPISNEEKTMKLTSEQKAKLGIEVDGDEVPETVLLAAGESLAEKFAQLTQSTEATAVADLTKRAEAGDVLVEDKRKEVLADAKLAELGADDKELHPAIADDIAKADVTRLQQLSDLYKQKIATKFPKGGRSSEEDAEAVELAGGVTKPAGNKLPKVNVH